ncbi:MAG: hypothetical protein FWD70_04045 [Desulfuromonadales bacterium]|nr:hypothetical protein [Desulfuromonadales bacterium]
MVGKSKKIRQFAKYTIIVFATIILLAGCVKSSYDLGSYDPTALPSTQCTLTLDWCLYMHKFDGEGVSIFAGNHFRLTPGTHAFLVGYLTSNSRSKGDISVYGNFEAGKEYIMKAYENSSGKRVNVYITEKPQENNKLKLQSVK